MAEDGRSLAIRWLLCAAPFSLAFAGIALIVLAPFAWDAGRNTGSEAWWPTNTALTWGIVFALIGGPGTVHVWRRTRYGGEIFVPQLAIGIILVFVAITALVYASHVANVEAYGTCQVGDTRLPPECIRPALEGLVQRPAFSWIFAGIVGSLTAVMTYLYVQAINKNDPSRHDRRLGEVDGVGELLRRAGDPGGQPG